MSATTKPRLISFSLCPYVRRSVITLFEKGIDFDITYIDLNNKPEWFLKLSPLGLVPILEVDRTVLFESAVINEYLDEISPPSLHPADPLQKARHRAMIEYGSALLGDLYVLSTTNERATYDQRRYAIMGKLERFEQECKGPLFNGESLCLVDAAMAPALHHIFLLKKYFELDFANHFPKVSRWGELLLQRDSVKKSVISGFEEDWVASYRKSEHFMTR